jgi:fructosamine-3-kinase
MKTYKKSRSILYGKLPASFYEAEYYSLKLLKSAEKLGGPRVATPCELGGNFLTLEYIESASGGYLAPADSFEFGRELAHLHNLFLGGTESELEGSSILSVTDLKIEGTLSPGCVPLFGKPDSPENYPYDGPYYFGPLSHPVAMPNSTYSDWASYYFEGRLLAMVDAAIMETGASSNIFEGNGSLYRAKIVELYEKVLESKTADASYLRDTRPALTHGDLWDGNVIWTSSSDSQDGLSDEKKMRAVLIDPAATIGNRESDLAMLGLFGCANYDELLRGYCLAAESDDINYEVFDGIEGVKRRAVLHNLFPILGHCVFFGGGYNRQFMNMIEEAIALF